MPDIYTSINTSSSPLVIDAVYEGDSTKRGYEPISEALGCANMGGFRAVRRGGKDYQYIVLYSRLDNLDWPDSIDMYNGIVTYYGDNKDTGSDLHKTPRAGNKILRSMFESLHLSDRSKIPPIFLFTKGGPGRDAIFRGLLIPGAIGLNNGEDLVAIWKMKQGERFQNYRAIFTILDEQIISREWIKDLQRGEPITDNTPFSWREWRLGSDIVKPLTATATQHYRKKSDQLPVSSLGTAILDTIYSSYIESPYKFEKCAAEIAKLMDRNIHKYDLTRRTRDGGRDATGTYKIGLEENAIEVEFALEAKCYAPNNSVGVRETSRLISRLRHRQFGILVTTSFLNAQACQELQEDGHPVIIVTGKDIVTILSSAGIDTVGKTKNWIKNLSRVSKATNISK